MERANRVLVTAIAVYRRAVWTIKMAMDKRHASQPVRIYFPNCLANECGRAIVRSCSCTTN